MSSVYRTSSRLFTRAVVRHCPRFSFKGTLNVPGVDR
jgi:hypothetical protein